MLGTTLGPYRLIAELGSGGMGTVWKAEGPGGVVALKVIRAHLLAAPDALARFRREAEVGISIQHPNVVATLAAGESDGRQWLALEYVEGQTLHALLEELGMVPEDLCRHIAHEVAAGLAAIHAAGVVHRDLKPENVLITRDHAVKVMDLGAAKAAEDYARLTQTGTFVGSLQYAAPEQFGLGNATGAEETGPRGASGAKGLDAPAAIDGRADLHALGVVLYELATGVSPYHDADWRVVLHKVLKETPRRLGAVNPQVSPFLEEVVHTLLAKDREQRFASAANLASTLAEGEGSAWWAERTRLIRGPTRRPLRRIRIPRETALIGRDAELARLREAFDQAKAGDGRVVLVEGEAGIGKSRLVDEFVALLQREGEDLEFLHGSYPPGGAATASGAFTTAYREHFGAEGLAETLAGVLTQAPLLAPAFAALLTNQAPPAGALALTKDSLQTCFVYATRAIAAERVAVVLIDDLHFAPEEGRALFAALALAVPGHRILLVGTARPGLDERWLGQLSRVGAVRLALSRLGAKDVASLLIEALRSESTAGELALQVLMKSDGNPFFVFEILRGLRGGRLIARKPDGTWVRTGVIGEIRIPTSVQELVQARFAELSQEERDLLDVAACLGFEFDPALLAEVVAQPRIPVLKALSRVERASRIVRAAGRRFVFDHHQVQEALYGSLPALLREEYHTTIAGALERRAAASGGDPSGGAGTLCVDLADHLLRGTEPARSLRYLDAALSCLERGFFHEAAIGLADRALSVPGLLAGRERCAILLRKYARLSLLGRAEAERRAVDEAVSLADASGDALLRASAWNSLGAHLQSVSRFAEAESALNAAITLARAAGDRRTEARATGNLGIVLWRVGRLDEARVTHERNLALSQEIGDVAGEAAATGNLGVVALSLGLFEDARARHSACLALARRIGDRRGEATAAGNLGPVLGALGRFAEARTQYEQSLQRLREIGFRRGEAVMLHNLGELLSRLGRAAEADECLGRALALAQETGVRHLEAATLRTLGDAAVRRGADERAEPHLRAAVEAFRELGTRDDEAGSALRSLGALLARSARREESLAHLTAAADIAREAALPELEAPILADLAAIGARDPADAVRALESGGARIDAYTRMEVNFLVWSSAANAAHLVVARRILDSLVEHAPPDCRGPMLTSVRLHREIMAAGVPDAP